MAAFVIMTGFFVAMAICAIFEKLFYNE